MIGVNAQIEETTLEQIEEVCKLKDWTKSKVIKKLIEKAFEHKLEKEL